MTFFFKRNKIVLDCFTDRADVLKFSPIELASKHYPTWWKQLPKSYNTQNPALNNTLGAQPTMKGCPGLIETFQHGIIMPLWSDVVFHITDKECHWQFSDHMTTAQSHEPQQWAGFLPAHTGYFHVKIDSPWLFKTKEDIPWTYNQPTWNLNSIDSYTILPGVVSYKYQTTTNINMFIHPKFDHKFLIEAGQPIAHLIPITEKEIVIKNHLLSEDEYKKIRATYGITNKFEKNLAWHKKMIDKHEKPKCPFGFKS